MLETTTSINTRITDTITKKACVGRVCKCHVNYYRSSVHRSVSFRKSIAAVGGSDSWCERERVIAEDQKICAKNTMNSNTATNNGRLHTPKQAKILIRSTRPPRSGRDGFGAMLWRAASKDFVKRRVEEETRFSRQPATLQSRSNQKVGRSTLHPRSL